jgi:NTE family protein
VPIVSPKADLSENKKKTRKNYTITRIIIPATKKIIIICKHFNNQWYRGKKMKKPSLALVLGGGGARGLAHIGVLKVLTRAGIKFDCICGTSIGGVIGACFASGMSPEVMEEKALSFSQLKELIKFIDLTPPRRGLLEGNKIKNFLFNLIDENMSFEQLRYPFFINAVDLILAKEVVFCKGPIYPAILATIAVPGIFAPVELDQFSLVDGGVLNNLPVNHARAWGADIILAIDVQINPQQTVQWIESSDKPQFPIPMPEFFLEFYRANLVMVAELTRKQIEINKPEILLVPPMPGDITMFLGFSRAKEIIESGEKVAKENLPKILEIINKKSSPLG